MSPSHWLIKAGGKDVSGSNSDPWQDQAQWWPFAANGSADWPRVQFNSVGASNKYSQEHDRDDHAASDIGDRRFHVDEATANVVKPILWLTPFQ